jgi:hypothetical protein
MSLYMQIQGFAQALETLYINAIYFNKKLSLQFPVHASLTSNTRVVKGCSRFRCSSSFQKGKSFGFCGSGVWQVVIKNVLGQRALYAPSHTLHVFRHWHADWQPHVQRDTPRR